jgi:release factor H-coupled RctB family protein
VGLPDLHPGKGSPIGAAFAVEGCIYPSLVGNDIGCGIGLWSTSLSAAKIKREAWAEKLRKLDGAWEGDAAQWLAARQVEPGGFAASLGTIGSGNHFAELQAVERVENEAGFAQAGLDAERVYLLVHSGSRGLGESILRAHTDRYGVQGLAEAGMDATEYIQQHQHAVRWAKANRELIALRILERLGASGYNLLDVCHNSVERIQMADRGLWLHRKGAAPSTEGLVAVPGSRGAFSYLVVPREPRAHSAFSLAHGAGRKWARSDSRGRLEKRFTAKQLTRTSLGSIVVCEDKDLLYEEAPQAYKNITAVIDDLVREKLVEVIAVLRPLVTYKVRRQT